QSDQKSANEILLTALILTLLFCVILTTLSVIFANQIISLCGSSADTHDAAVLYFRVVQAGMIFNVLSLCINAAQRGSGNTRIAMTTNVISSIVNVVFNYLLIGGNLGFPKWGVFGAAFATVLGTVAASIMSVRSLFSKTSYVSIPFIRENKLGSQGDSLLPILKLGSNMFVENLAMRVGFVVTAVLAAKLGTDAFAAHQVGMNFLSLGFSFGDGMQVAAVALIGRSLGENKPDKAKLYGSLCQRTGLGISFVMAIILFFFGRNLFSLFFQDPVVLDMGVLISKYIIVIILFQISQIIFGGCLRGAGDMRYCLFASLISVTLIRSLVTWGLTSVIQLGLHGIWIGILSDQVSRFLFLSLRFREGSWARIRI
ncbi:MAG: MATE family efflux transporter, partial [Solobacterium sp.]|nr:MATE family efflux transporter [Solobacterium sp.]